MSKLEMRPIEVDVFHNYSGSDARQVPAAGAIVAAAKQGATVTAAATCTTSADVTVHVANSGRIELGDIVTANASSNLLYVKSVAGDGMSVIARNVNPSGASFSLAVGDRLMCIPPTLGATVGTAVTCVHLSVTTVTLRGPVTGDSVSPYGDTTQSLSVAGVGGGNVSVQLSNANTTDVILSTGTPMLYSTGFVLFMVTADTTCTAGAATWVPMSVNALPNGAIVYPHADATKPLVVTDWDDASRGLDLNNATSSDIALAAWERLLPRATTATFLDASALLPLGANNVVLDTRGHARFYAPENRVDCFVTGGGLSSPLLLPDRLGGWVRGGLGVINARDYPSIQDAIDALPLEGGTVYIPAGTYTLTQTLYTPCDRICHLVGDGGSPTLGAGTTLEWVPAEGQVLAMLRVRGNNSSVRGLQLHNAGTAVPTGTDESIGYGLQFGRRDVADVHPLPGQAAGTEYAKMGNKATYGLLLEDVEISGAQGWGLSFPGTGNQSNGSPEVGAVLPSGSGDGTLSFQVSVRRCRIEGAQKFGALFVGGSCTTVAFEETELYGQGAGQMETAPNGNCYAFITNCFQVSFTRCVFEGFSPTTDAWVTVSGAIGTQFIGCSFEEDAHLAEATNPTYFVLLQNECQGGSIRDCYFARDGGSKGLLRLIKLDAQTVEGESGPVSVPGARGVVISNPSGWSGDSTTALGIVALPAPGYYDIDQVSLGGDANVGLQVVGQGSYWDLTQGPGLFPIQYSGTPKQGAVHGQLVQKVPEGILCELDPNVTPNGSVLMDRSLPGQGGLVFFKQGAPGTWSLANNLPVMDAETRDGRDGWSDGDMIYNSQVLALQIYVGGVWLSIPVEWD